MAEQSTSPSTPKILHFNVEYDESTIPIDIPVTGTVADIKLKLSQELNIAPCQQLLSAIWDPYDENTPLSELKIVDGNTFHLQIKPEPSDADDYRYDVDEDEWEVNERLAGRYLLRITDEYTSKQYKLKYLGTKRILEVKTDISERTNIDVRNQIWSGWLPNIDDQTMLALSGISYPKHKLAVRRCIKPNHTRDKKPSNTVEMHDGDDEEMFVDNMTNQTSRRIKPLIPEHIEDEIVGTISFSENFTARYGDKHPTFYQGTLKDALKQCCSKSAKDRKILAVYLHHDASLLSNEFAMQFGSDDIIQTMETNFILWGWDLTFESNRTIFENSVYQGLGSTDAIRLRNIPVNKLPIVIIIKRIRSLTNVYIVHRNEGVSELSEILWREMDWFMANQIDEIKEEDERTARELIRSEQDQEYRESLEADRAKEEANRMQERALHEERKRVETEKVEEAARQEAYRKQVEDSLPPEPVMDEGDNITKIRFRLPKGDNLERQFHANTPLKVLLDYLIVKGYPAEEYKVISRWPRRDLTALDNRITLQELKLFPQDTVILEER